MRTMELAAAILERGPVRLEPFEERHRAGLGAVAAAAPELFRHIPFPVETAGYGAWFDYLFVSPAQMRRVLQGTPWRLNRLFGKTRPDYVAVLERRGEVPRPQAHR